ncbi:ABC transporter substrate-binding protein [Paracraurococcus lichenis]|uniref:ABC transporter substrate-binding protein n=1 Tax=Paracraurococcus lichenis TaxID=3064888 RepID=A0ABT9E9B5_9PROT|nr:ABC transporter substrate-binding protein [Paracraurococcus sp. LOR1-02]MDO9712783.1 ABC transporter substrate-binding protein [Paracraurococcus sp. LOR1-02]
MIQRRMLLAGAAGAIAAAPGAARAQGGGKPVRIGVLNDMSGVYSDYQGRGSVVAAELAVADGDGRVAGRPVEVVFADHQNKPDIGASIARRWLDLDGVDMILDVPNSAVALAVAELCREKNKVFIGSGAGTSELTGAKCSPNTVHWTYDTWSLANSLGRALVERGGKRWFLLVADYAFGYDLQSSITDAVQKAGGSIAGAVRHPLGTTDYSSFLLTAQASRADVLCLANAGGDTTTALKQAAEFGLTRQMKVAGPVVNINMIQPIGLRDAQGLLAVMPFYWDLNEGTRAFAGRFQAAHPRHLMPNDMQAGCYGATLHFLKAVAQVGGAEDGRAVVAAMKAIPTDDPIFGKGTVRQDGRKIHPVYLMQAKTPAESRGEWDFFKEVGTVPAEQAYRPLADGRCPLVTG